ncbi:hypothetical protein [Chelativorans composti]|uniref:Uncharacterized protein n=1 Tax=Chelativorans composti TaxID=768533 RepID=A0ABW5DCZ3_9HYPH
MTGKLVQHFRMLLEARAADEGFRLLASEKGLQRLNQTVGLQVTFQLAGDAHCALGQFHRVEVAEHVGNQRAKTRPLRRGCERAS